MSWIGDHYGSRRGLWRHIRHQAQWRIHPSQWREPSLQGVERVVFVCKGNICRSALGGVVAQSMGFPACSYGLDTHSDKPADPVMLKVAGELGYDLSCHRTSPMSLYENKPGDLVLVFEPKQLESLRSGPGKDWKLGLLGPWAKPPVIYIHDPFGGTEAFYHRIAVRIVGAAGRVVAELRDVGE